MSQKSFHYALEYAEEEKKTRFALFHEEYDEKENSFGEVWIEQPDNRSLEGNAHTYSQGCGWQIEEPSRRACPVGGWRTCAQSNNPRH